MRYFAFTHSRIYASTHLRIRALTHMGWKHKISIKDGLRLTYQDFLKTKQTK